MCPFRGPRVEVISSVVRLYTNFKMLTPQQGIVCTRKKSKFDSWFYLPPARVGIEILTGIVIQTILCTRAKKITAVKHFKHRYD